ncbi:MAG: MerR family transcriptional regulator [Pseudomonadota bacterium]
MKTSDFARRFGVTTMAIRKYERLGMIHPRRTPGGHREYTEADAKRLAAVLQERRGHRHEGSK